MNYGKNRTSWYRRWFCLGMAVIVACGLMACGKGDESQDPLRATEAPKIATVPIDTMYCTLQFPESLIENLRHVEVTEGRIAMEVFYLVSEEGEKELYRIHFADAKMGELLGYLTIDGVEVPITHSVCEYANEDFRTEEERKLYYEMMDAFSVLVNTIYADARFSETRFVAPVGTREVKLRYWNVVLPENVQCVETEENGSYCVKFYGEVGGEQINLYMILVGNGEAETSLGFYTVDGERKPVRVQTYDMEPYANWSEEDQTIIYRMMESLNTVIQTIVADEKFSEF